MTTTAPAAIEPAPEALAPALLAWAEQHGRHDLPWQQDATPYRVWVSEVMLQQTQVATVLPFYERFMSRFPDLPSLAAAPLDEVLHLWTGLGYYARARNLHRAAQLVRERHAGCLPADIRALEALPGIGRSTAGAILALSRSQRHAILDGNARRVLARYFGIEGDPGNRDTLERLWAAAEACTPRDGVAEYTQAIMDLGSGVCLRSRARCDGCPLHLGCIAYVTNRQHALPGKRSRPRRSRRTAYALVVRDGNGSLLLDRRPATGFWGGLWSLPTFDSEAGARDWLAAREIVSETRSLPAQLHVFTHVDLTLELLAVDLTEERVSLPDGGSYAWFDCTRPAEIGLSKAVVDLLRSLAETRTHGFSLSPPR